MAKENLKVAVIDGQGGGIGKAIIERIKKENIDVKLLALGTNSNATSNMLRGGAHEGATGENAIIFSSSKVDIIIGVIGIIMANSMMGEMTSSMASAISSSDTPKILIPTNKCNIKLAIQEEVTLHQSIEYAIIKLNKLVEEMK